MSNDDKACEAFAIVVTVAAIVCTVAVVSVGWRFGFDVAEEEKDYVVASGTG